VLDHVFLDAVDVIRRAFADGLLERHPHEDRLAADILLGDLVWETSCSLPGDGVPPRVRADVTLDWSSWSQSAWRAELLGEPPEERPELGIEVVFRVQRLAERPDLDAVMAVVPHESPEIGEDRLERSGPVVEESYQEADRAIAVEVGFEGAYRLPETGPSTEAMAGHLRVMSAWIASTLVRLGDLRLVYLPPDPDPDPDPDPV